MAVMLLVAAGSVADEIRGGLLYDKWWVVNEGPEPAGDHPLYPPVGQKSGSTTFRCKECHGWDYKGADGAYGSGSHFTGIGGVYGTALSASELFDLIRSPDGDGSGGTTVNGHDFGNIGLTDLDIWDLVDFLLIELLDTDLYIGPFNNFIGNETQGDWDFNHHGMCWSCHGADGTEINFGTPEDPVWVGTVASENPWEFLHKARFGQPGTVMPSWIDRFGSDQGAADIGLHAQNSLPGGVPGGLLVFEDGFESGDLSWWSSVNP
jgi:thiosulfate dehydrogenase